MAAMDLQANPGNEILYVAFNQDFSCFVCGTETGFRVYSSDPFGLTFSRTFDDEEQGVGVVAMLYRTNILAFSGGGKRPKFQPHKVVLWDDREARSIAELSFQGAVKAVKLQRDLVVVALERKIYVYSFRTLTLLDTVETTSNPKGLCCLTIGDNRIMLATPGMQVGRALVVIYPSDFGSDSAANARERTTIIAAHESPIAALATDQSGRILATVSEKGTIVRLYDTSPEGFTGEKLRELRRGVDRAEIHSLVLSANGEWLVVASDKGTVHVFGVTGLTAVVSLDPIPAEPLADDSFDDSAGGTGAGAAEPSGSNATSNFRRISGVLPKYFSSEWSLAQFRVHDVRCIAAFGADPCTVVVVCANGSYYKARFEPSRGGEMVRDQFWRFDDAGQDAAPIEFPDCPVAVTSTTRPLSEEPGDS